jgi:redox-sensing transcriptional repressor
MPNSKTVERLIIYNRLLKDLDKRGLRWVTSEVISEALSNNSAQVRRDISSLGRKGKIGVGYNICSLINDVDTMLGLKNTWGVILVGAGNLGRALFHYPGFMREGFEFRGIVDNDKKKIGTKWGNLKIIAPAGLKREIKRKSIKIAIITVPVSSAPVVAGKIVDAGISEILNFAPINLGVPENVNVRYADLALELENLSYHLSERLNK